MLMGKSLFVVENDELREIWLHSSVTEPKCVSNSITTGIVLNVFVEFGSESSK